MSLHPKDAAERFVEFLGAVTLTTTSKDAFGARRCMRAKNELVFVSSTEGASFATKLSAH
jgi:hypothetical protein